METKKDAFLIRRGSVQGSKHRQLWYNNQDASLVGNFSIPAFGKEYQIGLVSDGCSGNPMFSHTEVGSNLLTTFAFQRIQNFLCAGASIVDIPKVLFLSVTEFIVYLTNMIMPRGTVWPYPAIIKGREDWSASTRFRNDYLAATLLGFIADDDNCVIFSAGDGIILINDDLQIIDQNDNPEYPSVSINQAGKGFAVIQKPIAEIDRLVISTDGLKHLILEEDFRGKIFSHAEKNLLGLQFLLQIKFNERPDLMKDDCTAATLLKIKQ